MLCHVILRLPCANANSFLNSAAAQDYLQATGSAGVQGKNGGAAECLASLPANLLQVCCHMLNICFCNVVLLSHQLLIFHWYTCLTAFLFLFILALDVTAS